MVYRLRLRLRRVETRSQYRTDHQYQGQGLGAFYQRRQPDSVLLIGWPYPQPRWYGLLYRADDRRQQVVEAGEYRRSDKHTGIRSLYYAARIRRYPVLLVATPGSCAFPGRI